MAAVLEKDEESRKVKTQRLDMTLDIVDREHVHKNNFNISNFYNNFKSSNDSTLISHENLRNRSSSNNRDVDDATKRRGVG